MDLPAASELSVPDDPDLRDHYFMSIALRMAQEAADRGEVPVGCVVVQHNRVLARASNRVEELNDPTAHAEMLAIGEACSAIGYSRLTEAELFCSLEPCFMCAGALSLARIKRVVFATRDPKFGACVSLAAIPSDDRLNHRYELREAVYQDLSARMLKDFFRSRRD